MPSRKQIYLKMSLMIWEEPHNVRSHSGAWRKCVRSQDRGGPLSPAGGLRQAEEAIQLFKGE